MSRAWIIVTPGYVEDHDRDTEHKEIFLMWGQEAEVCAVGSGLK